MLVVVALLPRFPLAVDHGVQEGVVHAVVGCAVVDHVLVHGILQAAADAYHVAVVDDTPDVESNLSAASYAIADHLDTFDQDEWYLVAEARLK